MDIKNVLCLEYILLFLGSVHLTSGGLRIIGGSDANIEDNPWDVGIAMNGLPFCGGSIISPNTVLTAGHCLVWLWEITPENNLSVIAGTSDMSELSQAQEVKFSLDDFTIHENFDNDTGDYDIAIIKLNEDLEYSSTVKNIELPDEGYEVPEGTPVTISGWGIVDMNNTTRNSILKSTTIYIIDGKTCKEDFDLTNLVPERMICAGVPSGEQDSCYGDSGSAAEVNGTLIGIVSWGSSERCGVEGHPGAYTNVAYFIPWIREHADL